MPIWLRDYVIKEDDMLAEDSPRVTQYPATSARRSGFLHLVTVSVVLF
jgi:hypothetical protein